MKKVTGKRCQTSTTLASALNPLKDVDSYNVAERPHGIVPVMHVYDRARDFCQTLPDEIIHSKTGFDMIVAAVRNGDPLPVVSRVHGELIKLMSTMKIANER